MGVELAKESLPYHPQPKPLHASAQVAAWRKEREARSAAAAATAAAGGARPAGTPGPAAAAAAALESFVVARYLDRPLLLGGRKFDLRIYALVLSFQPLRAYLHRCPAPPL